MRMHVTSFCDCTKMTLIYQDEIESYSDVEPDVEKIRRFTVACRNIIGNVKKLTCFKNQQYVDTHYFPFQLRR